MNEKKIENNAKTVNWGLDTHTNTERDSFFCEFHTLRKFKRFSCKFTGHKHFYSDFRCGSRLFGWNSIQPNGRLIQIDHIHSVGRMITLIENHHIVSNWFYYYCLHINLVKYMSQLACQMVPAITSVKLTISWNLSRKMREKRNKWMNMNREICHLHCFFFVHRMNKGILN